MRKSAPWMTIWDDRILEVAQEKDSVRAPVLVECDHMHISRSQISRRLRKLREYGLLNDLGNGVYSITADGESYLNGDLNAEELQSEDNNNGTATA